MLLAGAAAAVVRAACLQHCTRTFDCSNCIVQLRRIPAAQQPLANLQMRWIKLTDLTGSYDPPSTV